ncbi:MAG: helix-turn-helix domain-containing protein [Actinomycetota bacterium]
MEASDIGVADPIAEQAGFVAELVRRRMTARLSQGALGALMGYDRTYINKVERGALEPTADFTRKAEETLQLGGELWRRWEAFDQSRRHLHRSQPRRPALATEEPAPDLLVEQDEAFLDYADCLYTLVMRKRLLNTGEDPITRFFVRVAVDRYPGEPVRSNEHYRRNYLTLEELAFGARCGNEPMLHEVKEDRDATKEFWLLFHNGQAQFPLYPGEATSIEYRYHVTDSKWGPWFQRTVRLPTRHLGVRLSFPLSLDPIVWGVEIAPAVGQRPLQSPVKRHETADHVHFEWATDRPRLQARYRLEWKFRAGHRE